MTDTTLTKEQLATKIADEMHRQLNFARDRAQRMRASAADYFQRNDIAKAYRSLGGAEAIEDAVAQFNSLRLRISDGDFDE